ncbi:hypothetical protein D3C85_1309320 [compost metagenome]
MSQRRAGQRIILLLAVFDDLNLFATDNLTTLQADQHVRHTDVREDLVVHTPRTRRIFIERLQVTVEPVSTANASNQGQVGWRRTEPGLGVSRLHADAHVVADLGTREHQLIQHQLTGNAQVIGNTLIALELGTMASHAIVRERTRTVFHGSFVGQVDIDLVQYRTMLASGEGHHRHHCQNQCCK